MTEAKAQTRGVDHAGLHIVLKKILKGDADKIAKSMPTFGAAISEHLTDETVRVLWIFVLKKNNRKIILFYRLLRGFR